LRLRLLFSLAILASLAVSSLSTPSPASALSCGPCPAMTLDALNLRDGPSLHANVLLVIPAGAEVAYDATVPAENGYLAVSYGGVDGYAHQLYLRLFPAHASPTDWLNLRSDPNLGAEVLMVMPPGSNVEVLGVGENGYYSVRYEQRLIGFAHSDYLEFDRTAGFLVGDNVIVNTDALNLRSRASLSGSVRAVLFSGEELTVEDGPVEADGFTWYEVDGAQGTGWVAGEYLLRD
jgi:uncharacterized protein YgiM (DUF1202 family)